MFCFQCQETVKNQGCTIKGVCGKTEETANLQDLLVYVLQGNCRLCRKVEVMWTKKSAVYVCEALFTTITNAAWEDDSIIKMIEEGLKIRDDVKDKGRLRHIRQPA